MRRKFYLIVALALALAVSGGVYAYTYTTGTTTIIAEAMEGDIGTCEPAPDAAQPDWDSVLPGGAATEILSWDDFESGGWSGGSGWLSEWWHQGDAAVTTEEAPHGGSYHLRLRKSSGYADRPVNLAGRAGVRLQFWAKANSFEAGDFAECLVSPDDTNWTTVKTWVDGDDDNVYHFCDIDLSGFTMSSEFWIAFDAQMSASDDYLYIDDLKMVSEVVPETCGDVPTGDLYIVTPNPSYTGDLQAKVYLVNTAALTRAYRYLNIKLKLEGSVEGNDYRVLSLDNGAATFNLVNCAGGSHLLSVVGGSYCLVSSNPDEWTSGWSVTPELYCEVTQR
jgi:hypothetical protein